MASLFLFRNDLRLFDNKGLHFALESGRKVFLIYIHDHENTVGGASLWWLHHSLTKLSQNINLLGGKLTIFPGKTSEILSNIIKNNDITHVFWNRRYRPLWIEEDKKLKHYLQEQGVSVTTCNSHLLFEPWSVTSRTTQKPFQVFTPFWKRCVEMGLERNIFPAPTALSSTSLSNISVNDLNLLPKNPYWATGLDHSWNFGENVGEHAAQNRLHYFLDKHIRNYKKERDIPSLLATSMLSAHLAFGEISIDYIANAILISLLKDPTSGEGATHFLSELGWREFSYHLLFHHQDFETKPFRKNFEHFPWRMDNTTNDFTAWKKGQTGYPIIDAGMRQLWQTGWMHNRVRMLVASFLTKDLLIPWQEGASWFMDTLVDADAANNSAGWQWVSGCGADAAPYFRIFNPVLQSEKFDAEGDYIRRYVPELGHLSSKYIHAPWTAPTHVLKAAGITLGKNYPFPMIDHAFARKRALEAYQYVKDYNSQQHTL